MERYFFFFGGVKEQRRRKKKGMSSNFMETVFAVIIVFGIFVT
jgi:hypothetical protein